MSKQDKLSFIGNSEAYYKDFDWVVYFEVHNYNFYLYSLVVYLIWILIDRNRHRFRLKQIKRKDGYKPYTPFNSKKYRSKMDRLEAGQFWYFTMGFEYEEHFFFYYQPYRACHKFINKDNYNVDAFHRVLKRYCKKNRLNYRERYTGN